MPMEAEDFTTVTDDLEPAPTSDDRQDAGPPEEGGPDKVVPIDRGQGGEPAKPEKILGRFESHEELAERLARLEALEHQVNQNEEIRTHLEAQKRAVEAADAEEQEIVNEFLDKLGQQKPAEAVGGLVRRLRMDMARVAKAIPQSAAEVYRAEQQRAAELAAFREMVKADPAFEDIRGVEEDVLDLPQAFQGLQHLGRKPTYGDMLRIIAPIIKKARATGGKGDGGRTARARDLAARGMESTDDVVPAKPTKQQTAEAEAQNTAFLKLLGVPIS